MTRDLPNTIRFTVNGLGLKTMTPAGYDSVIDKIVPAGLSSWRSRAPTRSSSSERR
jgi:hypothetical protein